MAIQLSGVTRRRGAIVHVKETTLAFEAGHFNVLLGETGSGKTSLIKLMAGLDACTGGTIRIDGEDVTHVTPRRRNVSLVHQFFVNYPHMTVFENIASPLRVAGMPEPDVRDRVEEAATLLQLAPMLDRRPQELSGGQQQRTALARAIAKQSRAVFLDEPLANLDYKLREELRDQLPEILADRGAVVVYATSEPEEALLLGGMTALMHDGRVAQFGPTADVYRNPANLTAARAFSDPPINTARIEKRGARAHLGELSWELSGDAANLADGPYTVAVRPSSVLPHRTEDATVPLEGVVQITELTGSESSAHFTLGGDSWVSLAHGVHSYEIGQPREFYLDPSRCRYFADDGSRAA